MEQPRALQLLQVMIDYFEAGNQESDRLAKAILESDLEYDRRWRPELHTLLAGVEWTGLRAPEADLVAAALRLLQAMAAER